MLIERVVTGKNQVCTHTDLPSRHALDLGETAIYKQFRSRDVAAVIGCEKDHGLRDLIGCAEPAERNAGGNILHELVGPFYGMHGGVLV